MADTDKVTIGAYLATRLQQVGIQHYFGIPGDYNLALFDHILLNKDDCSRDLLEWGTRVCSSNARQPKPLKPFA